MSEGNDSIQEAIETALSKLMALYIERVVETLHSDLRTFQGNILRETEYTHQSVVELLKESEGIYAFIDGILGNDMTISYFGTKKGRKVYLQLEGIQREIAREVQVPLQKISDTIFGVVSNISNATQTRNEIEQKEQKIKPEFDRLVVVVQDLQKTISSPKRPSAQIVKDLQNQWGERVDQVWKDRQCKPARAKRTKSSAESSSKT